MGGSALGSFTSPWSSMALLLALSWIPWNSPQFVLGFQEAIVPQARSRATGAIVGGGGGVGWGSTLHPLRITQRSKNDLVKGFQTPFQRPALKQFVLGLALKYN